MVNLLAFSSSLGYFLIASSNKFLLKNTLTFTFFFLKAFAITFGLSFLRLVDNVCIMFPPFGGAFISPTLNFVGECYRLTTLIYIHRIFALKYLIEFMYFIKSNQHIWNMTK